MSDLDDAVRDRIVEHTPSVVPPYTDLLGRRRTRGRIRWSLSAAALAAVTTVVTVLAVAQNDQANRSSQLTEQPDESTVAQTYPQWGFSLRRPDSWQNYPYGINASLFDVIGYLSPDRLSDPCTRTANSISCGSNTDHPLVERLSRGSVVVTIGNYGSPGVTSINQFGGTSTTIDGQAARLQDPAPVDDQCERMGGTKQLHVTIARPNTAGNFLTVTACLSDPTADTHAAALRLIRSVQFSAPTATGR